jgi:hypothetical protein
MFFRPRGTIYDQISVFLELFNGFLTSIQLLLRSLSNP